MVTIRLLAHSRMNREIIVIHMANDDNLLLAERVLGSGAVVSSGSI